MANYAASVLAKGQAIVSQRNQAPEMRAKVPSVMELALKNQEYSIPDAAALRVSELRPVDIFFITKKAPGAGTAKVAAHTGTHADSAKVNLVYVSHVETFSLSRKIAENNIMTYQGIWNNLYEQAWRNLRTRHDTSALSFLYSNRCQLASAVMDPQIASAGAGNWDDTNYAFEISAADKGVYAQQAKAFMLARYFAGEYDVVADLRLNSNLEYAFSQGAGNDVNLAFQNAGIARYITQDQITNNYSGGNGLWMPRGSFAGLNWNEPLNRKGVNSGENEVGVLTIAQDPYGSGAFADISMYTARADTSANTTGGSTQDIVDQWELTLTNAYALPPLSEAGDSVVHLIAQDT